MKYIKLLVTVTTVFLFIFNINSASANQAACNPIDIKPEALGGLEIVPDIVPVGSDVVVRMPAGGGGASKITISTPKKYFEVVDYSPKTIDGGTAKAGEWVAKSGENLPTNNYDLTLKAKYFTAGKWVGLDATANVWGGVSYAHQSFFIYHDTMPISISLSNRNEAPQTTMDVVRKVTLAAVPDVNLTLATDKGMLGKTISAKTGQSLNVKANDKGEATAYLFTKEKDKVSFTASSSDSCQDSTVSQKFSVVRSDVGRNVTENYSWLWWLLAGLLIIITIVFLIIFWRRKKKKQELSPEQTPVETPENIEPSQVDINSSNSNVINPSINKTVNTNQSETLESLIKDEKDMDQTL